MLSTLLSTICIHTPVHNCLFIFPFLCTETVRSIPVLIMTLRSTVHSSLTGTTFNNRLFIDRCELHFKRSIQHCTTTIMIHRCLPTSRELTTCSRSTSTITFNNGVCTHICSWEHIIIISTLTSTFHTP